MCPLIQEVTTTHTPESLVEQLRGERGVVLLRSGLFDTPEARYSFVTARPFLTVRSFGSRCEMVSARRRRVQFGNPWHLLDELLARCELLDEVDLPFPLGGCFGYWGYDLKNFIEPRLPRRASNDLELPDCHLGFHDSLVVFDHRLGRTWIVSTGLDADGSRSEKRASDQACFWRAKLAGEPSRIKTPMHAKIVPRRVGSNLTRAQFINRVQRAQDYIRAGDIYQVNLSQRLVSPHPENGWHLFPTPGRGFARAVLRVSGWRKAFRWSPRRPSNFCA